MNNNGLRTIRTASIHRRSACLAEPKVEGQPDRLVSAAHPGDVMGCRVVCTLSHLLGVASEDASIRYYSGPDTGSVFCTIMC